MSYSRYLANELERNLSRTSGPEAQNFTSPTGGAYSVRLTKDNIEAWAKGWPMSKAKQYRAIEADFEVNGDLADIRCYIQKKYGLPNPNAMVFRNSRIDDQLTDCDMDFVLSDESAEIVEDMRCGAALADLVPEEHCNDYFELATEPDPIVYRIPGSGAIEVNGKCGRMTYYFKNENEALDIYNSNCVSGREDIGGL